MSARFLFHGSRWIESPLLRGRALAVVLLGAGVLAGCSRSNQKDAVRSAPTKPPQAGQVKKGDASTAAADVSIGEAADAKRKQPGETPSVKTAPSGQAAVALAEGKALYAQHCAACHGDRGDGQGLAATWLFPKPRDFTAGRFRLVSTRNGAPTRDDLHAVLSRGMPGSAMPPWAHLPQTQREALVDEVVRLYREGMRGSYLARLQEQEELSDEEMKDDAIQDEARQFVEVRTTPGAAAEVPPIAAADPQTVERGKVLYLKQGCASCHGNTGKGDGQQKMVDDEGLPTRPRDFTRGIFKGGHDAVSVYRRVAYGMPGTPMPSSSNMTPEDVVAVVQFVLSMSDEASRQAAILNRERIVAARIDRTPETADDSAWQQAEPVSLRMAPLWWRDGADPQLQVRALHDGHKVALRINWRDAAADRHDAGTHFFEDAVAAELYAGEAEPFVGMGDPKSPVDVWFWDADRQGPRTTVEDVYPNTVVDVYPFHEQAVTSAEFDRPETKDESQAEVSFPARAVGNPIAQPPAATAATTLTAGGPSTVTFRMPRSQLVAAEGQWSAGQWTVILRRTLKVDDPSDGVSLAPGQRASIAFAVWDGLQRDRDGKKLVTIWQDLELEQ